MKTASTKAVGWALALALIPAVSHSIEVFKNEDAKVDVGVRMQMLGTFENSITTEYAPGGTGNRDFTQIFLFMHQNRLKVASELDGVKLRFESSFGNDAFANAAGASNNAQLWNMQELNATFAFGENFGVVAGVLQRPESVRDASYAENLLFTGESELSNLFFNSGHDLGVYGTAQFGQIDALFGVMQGMANLPQRYIPEHINLPLPVIARIGFGNLKEDPSHIIQQGFEKVDELKYRIGGGAFWTADSNAGHGQLLSQIASQAEITKGPFEEGNMLFSGSYYNPFLKLGTYNGPVGGGLGPVDSQFWTANVDGKFRMPMGDAALVGGAEWMVEQFIVKGLYNRPKTAQNPNGGVIINGQEYTYGQLTVQGGEAYLAYVAPKWWAATRVDVLVPDQLLGASTVVTANQKVTVNSAFGNQTLWEITFPALGYRINKFVTLTAELEHNLNATEAIDTDGEYQLKTVPIESGLGLKYQPYQINGRLQLQIAF